MLEETVNAINKFDMISCQPGYIYEQKTIAADVRGVLARYYSKGADEVAIVRGLVNNLHKKRTAFCVLESAFIHGKKSMVEFDYYGNNVQKEMGDLVLVSTFKYGGKPRIQKFTVVQAKKDQRKKGVAWSIDEEQLFFLSHWPPFKGVSGIFANSQKTIVDHSGCLGSYLLFYRPGDGVFLSAKKLNALLGSKKAIAYDVISGNFQANRPNCYPLDGRFGVDSWPYWYSAEHIGIGAAGINLNVFRNVEICNDIFDLISHLTKMNIGEVVYSIDKDIYANWDGLSMLGAIVKYLRTKSDVGGMELLNYDFYEASNWMIDPGDAGFGLIHAIVNLDMQE